MRPPAFAGLFETYLPACGPPVGPYIHRYSPEKVSAVDHNGFVWGLYRDMAQATEGRTEPLPYVWIRFSAEVHDYDRAQAQSSTLPGGTP